MVRSRLRSLGLVVAIGAPVCLAPVVAADVLADLGVTEEAARNTAFNWFCGGGVSFPGDAKVFKGASAAVRAEMVKALLTFGRAYLQSDDFAGRYAAFRDANRPQAPDQGAGGSNAMAAGMQANIKQMQEQMKTMPPDMQKQMQETIEVMRAQMKEMMDDPEMRQMMDDAGRREHEEKAKRHEEEVREFDARYPADVDAMIAGRLREFLDLTAGIDFDAKLVQGESRKTFADPKLEQKPSEWKFCFRAGKPSVDAARAFAQAWLAELQ